MNKDQIRQKLNNYTESFEAEAGNFNSFSIVHDYVGFLKSELYTKEHLADIIIYAEAQTGQIFEEVKNDKKTDIAIADITKLGVFPNEMEMIKQVFTDKARRLGWDEALAVNYATLFAVYTLMEKIQEAEGEERDNLIKIAKEEAFAIFTIKNPADGKDVIMDNATYVGMAMFLINKHLIDLIDAENLVANDKTAHVLSFDKNKSELNFYGVKIEITIKGEESTKHYILEAIFDNENLGDEVYFKDIAKDYLGILDYNIINGWYKFRTACDNLNSAVDNSTNHKAKQFIIYHSGLKGRCKINPKYL